MKKNSTSRHFSWRCGHDRQRRRLADLEAPEGLQVREVGQVGGGLARAALGDDEDRVEGLHDEDGAEQHAQLTSLHRPCR
jgi:hypothetical protein